MEKSAKIKITKNHKFSDFNVSNRLINCLRVLDITKPIELTKIYRTDVFGYRMFGYKTRKELFDFMEYNDLNFLEEKRNELSENSFLHETNLSNRGMISIMTFVGHHEELAKKFFFNSAGFCDYKKFSNMKLKDLKGYTKKDFLRCRNFGNSRFLEIKKVLQQVGIEIPNK